MCSGRLSRLLFWGGRPQQGPYRHSMELLQPASEAYAARLSLDVNNGYPPAAASSIGRSSNAFRCAGHDSLCCQLPADGIHRLSWP